MQSVSLHPPAGAKPAADLFTSDRSTGRLFAASGKREALFPGELLRSLHDSIIKMHGDAAQDVLYRTGYDWGLRTARALQTTSPAPSNPTALQLQQRLTQAWHSLALGGWGTTSVDLAQSNPAAVRVRIHGSVLPEVLGRSEDPVCHLIAGLLAGIWSFLARSERHSAEIGCTAAGQACCEFILGGAREVDAIEGWRQQAVAVAEILRRLQFAAAPEQPASASTPPGAIVDTAGARIVLVPAELLGALRYVAEGERAGSWSEVMKETGRAWGRRAGTQASSRIAGASHQTTGNSLETCLAELQSRFCEYGWGRLSVDLSGAAEYGLVTARLTNSYFAALPAEGASSGNPLASGVLQGYFEHVTGQALAAVEIAAGGPAAPESLFAISTPEHLQAIAPYVGGESAEQILARLRA